MTVESFIRRWGRYIPTNFARKLERDLRAMADTYYQHGVHDGRER